MSCLVGLQSQLPFVQALQLFNIPSFDDIYELSVLDLVDSDAEQQQEW